MHLILAAVPAAMAVVVNIFLRSSSGDLYNIALTVLGNTLSKYLQNGFYIVDQHQRVEK